MLPASVTTALVAIECGHCGMAFAIPKVFNDENREQGPARTFYCPNGHPRTYRKGEVAELRDELAAKTKLLADALSDRDKERNRADAAEANRTRLLKRVRAGVCPHCHRTFSNMARHVQSKHGKAT